MRLRSFVIRFVAAMSFGLAGILAGFVLVNYGALLQHSASNGVELDRQFRAAGQAIGQFERLHGRPPDHDALRAILSQEGRGRYRLLVGADLCDDTRRFDPAGETLVLSAWRGEWMECFSPRTGVGAVVTDPNDVAVLGSVERDQGALAAICLSCLGLAARLGMGRPLLKHRPPAR